jgi:CHAT domain-containing protein
LSDNGSAYIAKDTLDTATALGLNLCFTPVRSPESNGIAEAFVKTFKRDYTRLSILPDAATIIMLLPAWFEDYNDVHPHSGLKFLSPREFLRLSASAGDKPGAEALSGLARAFFYAGAKSLVVSHWEVDSEATVAPMDGLFETLKANPRLSKAEALRMSMLRMIANSSKPEWAQPEFWAPFVVVGEPMKPQ